MTTNLKSSPWLLPLGLLYLLIILCGVYAHFIIRLPLLEAASDADRLHRFFSSSGGIRLSLLADIVMVLADVAVGWLFYLLFRPVHKGLALTAALFRWVQSGILAYGIFGIGPLQSFLSLDPLSMDSGDVLALSQSIAEILARHSEIYIISGLSFGLSCLILGALFIKAQGMPGWMGALLQLAGLAYILDGAAHFLFPAFAGLTAQMVAVAALFAEVFLCFWLLWQGVRKKLYARLRT